MKALFVFFFAIGLIRMADAQVIVNDIDINKLDVEYIEMVAVNKPFSITRKVVVGIDYGQEFDGKSQGIKGPDGKLITFISTMAALNFMSKNGWEWVDTSVQCISADCWRYYLLKRKE